MPYNVMRSQAWAITPNALSPILKYLNTFKGETLTNINTDESVSSQGYFVKQGVAIIEVQGVINRRSGSFWFLSWEGQDRIRKAFDVAMEDPSVKAVLLSFDSPGGVATGTKELADHIRASTAKPIYAYADGLCASAAFWLASATSNIYAPETATLGSIGVLYVHMDTSGAVARAGLNFSYITGGTHKAIGNNTTPLSDKDRAYIQKQVSDLHQIFQKDIASHLNLSMETSNIWGDAQVFLAQEALSLGLIEGIVKDRDELISQISKETSMDFRTFAKAHPELLAEIQAEAKKEAQNDLKSQEEGPNSEFLSLVKVALGDEAEEKVSSLIKAGVNSEQLQAVMAIAGKDKVASEAQENSHVSDKSKKDAILDGIMGATPAPVNTSAKGTQANPLQEAIERMAAMEV